MAHRRRHPRNRSRTRREEPDQAAGSRRQAIDQAHRHQRERSHEPSPGETETQPGMPAIPDPAIWSVVIDGQEEGPFPPQILRQMAEDGRIQPDTPIRKKGMEKFVRARKVNGLLPAQPTEPAAGEPAETEAASEPVTDEWDAYDTEELPDIDV